MSEQEAPVWRRGLEPDDPRHGTANGYRNCGCRCDDCRAAWRVETNEGRRRRREKGEAPMPHGTAVRYREHMCRCDECKDANAAEARASRARGAAENRGHSNSPLEPDEIERLLLLFDQEPGCWEWKGRKVEYGYGSFDRAWRVRGRNSSMPAHRAVYTHFKGKIPKGLDLDHLCRNTSCVNPHHLEPVTKSENSRRMNAAKRGAS